VRAVRLSQEIEERLARPAKSFIAICCLLLLATPAFAQSVLYDNGPDADIGYSGVNFGAETTNSFLLPREAAISNFTLTIYAVDDRNVPKFLRWTITSEPFGGTVFGAGVAGLSALGDPYLTKFLFFAYKVGFQVPELDLPSGTYYIQLQDVVTQWDTRAFWAVSAGRSTAYYSQLGPSEYGTRTSPVQILSESFAVFGKWMEAAPR
jgi:hypothetical protein